MKVQQWTISIKWWKTENIHTPFKQIKIYTLIRSISQTSVKLLKKKTKMRMHLVLCYRGENLDSLLVSELN